MLKIKNGAVRWVVLIALGLLAGCTPPGPRALLDGIRLLDRGEPVAAVARLEVAASLLKTNALAWSYLGLAYHESGSLSNALGAYQQALRLDHDLVDVRYNLGCAFLDANRPDLAKLEFTTFVMREPRALDGWLKLGTAQLRNRELPAAERSLGEALKLSPGNPAALNSLGLVQMQRNRPREAAGYFSAALKTQPVYAPALKNLAVVSLHLNNRQFALDRLREYAALTPRPPDADAALAWVRQLEAELAPPPARPVPPPVTAELANVVTNPPRPAVTNPPLVATSRPPVTRPEPVTNQMHAKPPPVVVINPSPTPPPKGNLEVVKVPDQPPVKFAQDNAAVSPPSESPATGTEEPVSAPESKPAKRGFFSRLNPMNLFKSDGKSGPRPTPLPPRKPAGDTQPPVAKAPAADVTPAPPAAVKAPSTPRYVYLAPTRPAAGNRKEAERAFVQAVASHRANRLNEAIQSYLQATQADPAYFEAWYNLGLAAHEARRYPQSLAAYETALALEPNSMDARYNFALVLRDAGYWLDAGNELEKVLAYAPNDVRAHFALANLYARKLHQPQRARLHYLKVLEADPQHPQAANIRAWLLNNPG